MQVQFMSNEEWESLSADSRHRINQTFKDLQDALQKERDECKEQCSQIQQLGGQLEEVQAERNVAQDQADKFKEDRDAWRVRAIALGKVFEAASALVMPFRMTDEHGFVLVAEREYDALEAAANKYAKDATDERLNKS